MKLNIVLRPNTNSRKIPGFHSHKIQPQVSKQVSNHIFSKCRYNLKGGSQIAGLIPSCLPKKLQNKYQINNYTSKTTNIQSLKKKNIYIYI